MSLAREKQLKLEHDLVRTLLRHATHQHHVQLNKHRLLAGLTGAAYSLEDYQQLLLAYHHIYQLLEERIDQFVGTHACPFDYAPRRKSPWLERDIAFFGRTSLAKHHLPPPGALRLPDIGDVGQLTGVLYVIEGSTLGGQLISGRLAENHGLTSSGGACFFSGYGEQTAAMWQDFISFSETISGDAAHCRTAIDSACQTFQSFTRVLDHYAY
ncbi:MAG: biliverdin-producing heme oxygenase [Sideroxydans sp.]